MSRTYVRVYGCSANVADSEIVSGLIEDAGHRVVDKLEDADAVIVLTCTVKSPTQHKVLKYLEKISGMDLPLVVAGCMPKAQQTLLEKRLPEASLMGPDDLDKTVEVLEGTLEGRQVVEVDGAQCDRTCKPRVRQNEIVHIAPISTGCLGNCSYCIVKNARGHLHSYPTPLIVDDAKKALKEGCREIWVTAEDTAAYNWSGVTLPDLLKKLTDLEEDFRLRIGMMTPNQALRIKEELMEAYESDKIFKFLHVPVQAGSDRILEKMRRYYHVKDFKRLVRDFRERFPEISISTDIICGFPGETEKEFQMSLDLVKEIRPEVLNISRYWPRPGTDAAEMPEIIHGRITKERSRALTKLWKDMAIQNGERWIGWSGKVLVDEHGKGGDMVGRNYTYKPVAFPGEANIGEFVDVTVTDTGVGYLQGHLT